MVATSRDRTQALAGEAPTPQAALNGLFSPISARLAEAGLRSIRRGSFDDRIQSRHSESEGTISLIEFARRIAAPHGSHGAKVPRPHRSDGGTGRDRRGQAFHLRQGDRSPVLLLGPAADDREVDVCEREPVARQVRLADHVRFHDEPPCPPHLPRALAHRVDLVGVGRETLGIVVDLHDRVDLRRREEEPAKGLGARQRPLRRQQGRLGVAIVEGGADPNVHDDGGQTPVHFAATWSNKDIIAVLAGRADANAQDKDGSTPVHNVVCQGRWWTATERANRTGSLTALLHAGANPDVADQQGLTPLHWAARRGLDAAISALLGAWVDFGQNARVDRDARDCNGWTALHWAIAEGSTARSRYRPRTVRNRRPWHVIALLEAGADPNARNNDGQAPLHLATQRNLTAEIDLLRTAGADPI